MRPTKFIIFVLVIVQALCGSASAQSVTAHTLATSDVEHVIVKSYTYPATITSCNFSDPNIFRSMFIYSDANHKSIQVILDGYRVNDFAIDNDTVFFCGHSDTLGIIGFFNIQDLFFNSGTFRIQPHFDVYEFFSSTISRPVENLTKLVTYSINSQKRHIVCIGYTNDYFHDGYHYSCIVDMHLDARRPISPWYYESGTIHGSDSNYFKDITLAGNYVIAAGFDDYQYISMHLFKADDIFSSTGPQNNARVFLNGSNKWDTCDLLLTTVRNGVQSSIATATKWNVGYSQGYMPIHLATYGLSQLVAGSSSSMTGSAVMNVTGYDRPLRLYDFITIRKNNSYPVPATELFALVHLGENSSSEECSIFSRINTNLQSAKKSILANSYCRDDYHRGLQSVDRYNGNSQFVIAGIQSHDNRELTFNVEPLSYAFSCQDTTGCFIDSHPLIDATIQNKPVDELGGLTGILFVSRSNSLVLPITIECNKTTTF